MKRSLSISTFRLATRLSTDATVHPPQLAEKLLDQRAAGRTASRAAGRVSQVAERFGSQKLAGLRAGSSPDRVRLGRPGLEQLASQLERRCLFLSGRCSS